jgi:hypothetical protein
MPMATIRQSVDQVAIQEWLLSQLRIFRSALVIGIVLFLGRGVESDIESSFL